MVCLNASVVMIVLQLAMLISRLYAGAVSLVERNNVAHPKRFSAKLVTIVSRLDCARSAATGASALLGSFS